MCVYCRVSANASRSLKEVAVAGGHWDHGVMFEAPCPAVGQQELHARSMRTHQEPNMEGASIEGCSPSLLLCLREELFK